jgi:hypothetical protein
MYHNCKASAITKIKEYLSINLFEKHYFFIKTFLFTLLQKRFPGSFSDILAKKKKAICVLSIPLKYHFNWRSDHPNLDKFTILTVNELEYHAVFEEGVPYFHAENKL